MSYCRWSSVVEGNFESDLYVYDHVGGYIALHVAQSRREGIENAPPLARAEATHDEHIAAWAARMRWREKNPGKMVPIELPYAGESFEFPNPEACIAFLQGLKELGYRFPAYMLERSTYDD